MLELVIADDDEIFAEYIKKCVDWSSLCVKPVGYAADGCEAYELISRLKPDIVVMDVEMPGASGLDCVERLIASGINCQFVLVTGHGQFEYASRGAHHGINTILLKPVTAAVLEHAIRRAANACWAKLMSDNAMACALGNDGGDIDLPVKDAPVDSVPGLLDTLIHDVSQNDENNIDIAVFSYLSAVRSLGVGRGEALWLSALPALVCRKMLMAARSDALPSPMDDLSRLLAVIQHSSDEELQSLLCELCVKTSLALKNGCACGKSAIAAEVYNIISTGYSDPKFNLSVLAEKTHFHEAYLRRVCRSVYGKSPGELLRDIRMLEAKRLITEENVQVQQAAQAVGFEDASYFSKCYKKFFGHSPSSRKNVPRR